MTLIVDVRWPIVSSGRIPLQHQYVLLSAISRLVPELHHAADFGIHSIRGVCFHPGYLDLTPNSALIIRTRIDKLQTLLPISGKKLELAGCPVRVGIPQLIALSSSQCLSSHLVTIKGYLQADEFALGLRRQLDKAQFSASIVVEIGPRRIVKIKRQVIVGFQVILDRLNDSESLQIQEIGLGGRRHLGCGLFSPIEKKTDQKEVVELWHK